MDLISDRLKQPLEEQQVFLSNAVPTASDFLKATPEVGARLVLPDKKEVLEGIAKSKNQLHPSRACWLPLPRTTADE